MSDFAALAGQPPLDRGTGAEPPPGLYPSHQLAETIPSLDCVNDEAVTFFRENGYLAVRRAYTREQVDGALAALVEVIDGHHPEFTAVQFERSARQRLDSLSPAEKHDAIRKLDRFFKYDRRLVEFLDHPGLLSCVKGIFGAPPVFLWDQALLKPPGIGREKPWHQDHAVFDFALETPILGVWVALDEATTANGCMHVIPGSHKGGPVIHFQQRDFQICDSQVAVDQVIAVPLAPGGCLLFDSFLHHGTPPNRSPHRRRALQFWYTPPGPNPITPEERLAIWSSEGKDMEFSPLASRR